MDELAYKIMRAWMRAYPSDPDAALIISEQFLAGRISPEQAMQAWLYLT
jgi:hypothetical protein